MWSATVERLIETDAAQQLTHSNARIRPLDPAPQRLADDTGDGVARIEGAERILADELYVATPRSPTAFGYTAPRRSGEFDGAGKYLREEYTGGRSTADIVMAEKAREDRLRALGAGVTRWGWVEAQNPPALRRKLLAAGLPLQSSR